MGFSLLEATDTAEAFAAEVVAFANALNVDSLAKLISFFHLSVPDERTKVDFKLESFGQMTLNIEAFGEEE